MRHHSFPIWELPKQKQTPVSTPEPVTESASVVDYSSLLKRELLALAEERNLSVSSRDTKAEIIAVLEAND